MILAGDIGGTKATFGLFDSDRAKLKPLAQRTFHTKDFRSLEEMVGVFLSDRTERISGASFGVAAPIVDGHSESPNIPWSVSPSNLRRQLNIQQVTLINDLQAMALGIASMPEESFVLLKDGTADPRGCRGVIAAGTGLGEAALSWSPAGYRILPSEAGHGDFAPRNDLEIELLRYLLKTFKHASYERVLSGPGLANIYHFLREFKEASEPAWLTQTFAGRDAGEVITEMALSARDMICVEAVDLFVSIYGAEAGNMALNFLATGGIYLGGGIAPKLLPQLMSGGFVKAFTDKGRLSKVLSRMPVRVIMDTRAPLFGAAQYAWSDLQSNGVLTP